MSDDLIKNIPSDSREITATKDNDRINLLISAVQSLAADFRALSADFQDVKVRITAIETTVNERPYETKPIWERALAEIAATRTDLAETRTELKAEIAEVRTELKADIAAVRTELAEMKTELRTEMEDGFRKLGSKIELLTDDSLTVRADQRHLNRRVESLESKNP